MGTSDSGRKIYHGKEDHPHACGDKKRNSAIVYQLLGSSPRVWGQVDIAVNAVDSSGIIPTRVGTSFKTA